MAKNNLKCGLTWPVLLLTMSTHHHSSPKDFFVLFLHVTKFAKVFERIVWHVQVAQLHSAACALWSPSFQLSTNLDISKYTSSQWSKFVDTKLSHSPSCAKFVDYRSWIINRLLDVLVCSIAVCFYWLFVFWLALWALQNTSQLVKYTTTLHTKTSNKIYICS